MTREQEILEEISDVEFIDQGLTISTRHLSLEKLASYLARMESTKSEERVGLLETAYRHGGKEGVEYVQSSEEKKCEGERCNCEIPEPANCTKHIPSCVICTGCLGLHSPTPPDAWEEFCDLWDKCFPTGGDTRCRVQRDEILDWLHSKKKEWEVRAQMKCSNTNHTFLEQEARTTTLDELATYIQDQLEEAHSQGTYKYDWLYEDILEKIEKLRLPRS